MIAHDNRKALGLAIAVACLTLAPALAASAAAEDAGTGLPKTVILSPNGGRFFVQERLKSISGNGVSIVAFSIPGEAGNLRVEIPDNPPAHWTTTSLRQDSGSGLAQSRRDLLAEQARLTGLLESARARAALWKNLPEQGLPFREMEQRDSRMTEIIASTAAEEMQLRRELEIVAQTLGRLPQSNPLRQRVEVTLRKPLPAGESLPVSYSYTLQNCGWRPVYTFEADPEKDEIAVRLSAEIRQFTGMDWNKARLTLVSHSPGRLEPAPLPRWEMESVLPQADLRRPTPAALRAARFEELTPAAGPEEETDVEQQSIQADTSGVYAVWNLDITGLTEGVSRLVMAEDAWKAELQWLARPLRGDGRVWLTAKYTPTNKAWPAGEAEYSVDGQYLGQGLFRPRSGQDDEARLFFGVDPRVRVTVTADDKKRGESGFIDKKRVWNWAWIFTLNNAHNRPVNVRLERPEPVAVDQAVEVAAQNSPPATKDGKNRVLFWEITVPAKGKAEVKHAVTVKAPADMPLEPAAP
ncbi:MAG: DUF4139 domain-containing protein [Desulfovibrio sp.]|jgi:uncharacterized protein (TIGR02231 family)|nr:DUF4139 domain-containing protein [Desulfovibrio sp.]